MDKKILDNYRANKRLIARNKQKIAELEATEIPEVHGTVKGSMTEHPYLERRFPVIMSDPEETERQRKQKSRYEAEIERAGAEMEAAEQFIQGIPDVLHREILTARYVDGRKVEEIGGSIGYSKGRISQIISEILKD